MVIYNFNFNDSFFLPNKADTPLTIYSYAVLTFPISFKLLKSVPGGIRNLCREIAAFKISSLILAVLLIILNLRTSKSANSFSVSLHLNDFIIPIYVTTYVMRQAMLNVS